MKMKTLLLILMVFSFSMYSGNAQIDIRGKVKSKTMERVERKVDEGIDRTLDKIEESPESIPEEEKENIETETEAKQSKSKETPQSKTPLSTYSRYDFIPGERVLFYEDFSQDKVGDFPTLWNTNKGGEVLTTNNYPGHWFMMKEDGLFFLDKGLKFPENYTLEFDVIPVRLNDETQQASFDFTILASDDEGLFPVMFVPGKSGIVLNLSDDGGMHTYANYNEASYLFNGEYDKPEGKLKTNELNHVSIWVQKTRFRLYLHGEKIFDIPRALQAGHQYDQIRFYTGQDSYPLVSNIRIADAAPDTRSKLLTEGKLVTRGITFDSGSDRIKPQSYAVLKEISQVLRDNTGVKVRIVGHTDSDGNDAANLTLSQKRAVAVKMALSKEFGIDASRMETDGKGESVPVSSNDTAEGKANNRRVEFIKF